MSVSQKPDQSWTLHTQTHNCSHDHLLKALVGEWAQLLLISMRIIKKKGEGGDVHPFKPVSNTKPPAQTTHTHTHMHTPAFML